MALRDSVLLIRDYENIRKILRDIYIFGCFTRDDFIEMGMSGRKYDNEQRRLSAYLPEKFLQKRRVDKKVLLYCTYRQEDSEKNYLAETYRNKSFTTLDVMSYFFIQQLLNENIELSAPEILESLPLYNEERIFTKDNLRTKLDELIDKGYLTARKDGRKTLYSLAEDLWKDFSNEELLDLLRYTEFVMNVSPFELPYFFLYKKLALYIECERHISVPKDEIFAFKHNHLFNALDNDILLEILRACSNGTTLQVKLSNQLEEELLPVKVIHDSTYGRQYLCAFSTHYEKRKIVRLDLIESIRCDRKMTQDELTVVDGIIAFLDECWCTAAIDEDLREVVIHFIFDEEEEPYVFRRIIKEGHDGDVKRLEKNKYEYRLRVRDPREMIPWIRSFGERAKVVSSGEYDLSRLLSEEWKKAVANYESI